MGGELGWEVGKRMGDRRGVEANGEGEGGRTREDWEWRRMEVVDVQHENPHLLIFQSCFA